MGLEMETVPAPPMGMEITNRTRTRIPTTTMA